MSQDQNTTEQGPSEALSASVSASDPGVGASRRPDPFGGPQAGAEGFEGEQEAASAILRDQIRDALKASGLKQIWVAEQLGISQKHLSQMLTGRVTLTLDWAQRIASLCRHRVTTTVTPAPAALRQRLAEALMRWAEGNNDPKYARIRRPETVTANAYGRADAVLAELKRELDALAEYENTINWHTTCTSCARILDSAHRETERAEKAEAALREVLAVAEVIDANGIKWAADSIRRAAAKALHEPAPAHDAGPTIAECAEADRAHWTGKYAGEV